MTVNGHNVRDTAEGVEDWIWSPEPVHEAMVDLETFVQAQQVAERRARSRTAAGLNRHPDTRRSYRLRGYLYCSLCGRRMSGRTLRDTPYDVCAPKKGYVPPGHPPACGFWIGEEHLVDGLGAFLADRVFGAYRRGLPRQPGRRGRQLAFLSKPSVACPRGGATCEPRTGSELRGGYGRSKGRVMPSRAFGHGQARCVGVGRVGTARQTRSRRVSVLRANTSNTSAWLTAVAASTPAS